MTPSRLVTGIAELTTNDPDLGTLTDAALAGIFGVQARGVFGQTVRGTTVGQGAADHVAEANDA